MTSEHFTNFYTTQIKDNKHAGKRFLQFMVHGLDET